MSPDTRKSSCWVISDGAAGNERQALALAGALGLDPRVLQLRLTHPWDWLSPHLCWGAQSAMRDGHGDQIKAPWPDIAIGCGRKAALLTRCLRSWSKGHCFTVQILDPRTRPGLFDLVITPQHDQLSADNVIRTVGALNPVDANWLELGRSRFPQLESLPSPRTGVLIGASTASMELNDGYFSQLLAELGDRHDRHGGSFLVSTSRRTRPQRVAQLRAAFKRWPGLFWSGAEDGENPYSGILGWSDCLVVSPDSVNMVSEACATGRPVTAFANSRAKGKLGEFYRRLNAGGHLVEPGSDTPAIILSETRSVADQVRARRRARQPFVDTR